MEDFKKIDRPVSQLGDNQGRFYQGQIGSGVFESESHIFKIFSTASEFKSILTTVSNQSKVVVQNNCSNAGPLQEQAKSIRKIKSSTGQKRELPGYDFETEPCGIPP